MNTRRRRRVLSTTLMLVGAGLHVCIKVVELMAHHLLYEGHSDHVR